MTVVQSAAGHKVTATRYLPPSTGSGDAKIARGISVPRMISLKQGFPGDFGTRHPDGAIIRALHLPVTADGVIRLLCSCPCQPIVCSRNWSGLWLKEFSRRSPVHRQILRCRLPLPLRLHRTLHLLHTEYIYGVARAHQSSRAILD